MSRLIRASNPAVAFCAGAAAPYAGPLRHHAMMDVGTNVHAALALAIQGKDADPASLTEEERRLFYSGLRLWEDPEIGLARHFLNPESEADLSTDLVGAHTDVVSGHDSDAPLLAVADFKAGRIETDVHMAQVKTYLVAALEKRRSLGFPDPVRIYGAVLYLQDTAFEGQIFTLSQIERHSVTLATNAAEGQTANPRLVFGRHCLLCAHSTTCAATNGAIQSANLTGEVATIPPSGGALERFLAVRTLVKRRLDEADTALRAMMMLAPLPLPDGFEYALEPEERRAVLVSDETRQILALAGLNDQEIDSICKIGNGALSDALGACAPKRGKGKLIAATWKALDAAGQVEIANIYKARIRRAKAAAITAEPESVLTDSE